MFIDIMYDLMCRTCKGMDCNRITFGEVKCNCAVKLSASGIKFCNYLFSHFYPYNS